MGVTLARKAILGGLAEDPFDGGSYNLGPNLTSSVHTFVGISGQCQGMNFCREPGYSGYKVCDDTVGHWPGVLSSSVVVGRSKYLEDLLTAPSGFEGTCRYSMGSTAEILYGKDSLVNGIYTWNFPGTTDAIVYDDKDHVQMHYETGAMQF